MEWECEGEDVSMMQIHIGAYTYVCVRIRIYTYRRSFPLNLTNRPRTPSLTPPNIRRLKKKQNNKKMLVCVVGGGVGL